MSLTFFLVGGLIFAVYMYFTIWNIFYSSKKQRQERERAIEVDHNVGAKMDGARDFLRLESVKRGKIKTSK